MAQPKRHAIHKSGLYRIGRKKDLAALLQTTLPALKRLATDDNYSEWTKYSETRKPRLIEEPLPRLDRVQRRMHEILKRIETPDWLQSGKKGSTSQKNARVHAGECYVVNVDIQAFFQSTKREYVYRCFQREFGMTNDVASLLASLLTYKGHIPTGTSTSQDIAFWAYRQTFERIHRLCEQNDIVMTLWVDDITFSRSTPFPKGWTSTINKILSDVQLNLKMKKTKRYGKHDYKIVTGTALSPQGSTLVRNAKRNEIVRLLSGRKVEDLNLKEARSLFGKLASQRQNESGFFQATYIRCKNHIRALSEEAA